MPAAHTLHPAALCLPKQAVKVPKVTAAVQESLTVLTKNISSDKISHKNYIVIKYEN